MIFWILEKNQPFNNLKQKFPYLTEAGHRLLNQMLCYNPEKRVCASEALKHPYFNGEVSSKFWNF